jgi:hypothetical protein
MTCSVSAAVVPTRRRFAASGKLNVEGFANTSDAGALSASGVHAGRPDLHRHLARSRCRQVDERLLEHFRAAEIFGHPPAGLRHNRVLLVARFSHVHVIRLLLGKLLTGKR